jgi:hypothetical protein
MKNIFDGSYSRLEMAVGRIREVKDMPCELSKLKNKDKKEWGVKSIKQNIQ